MVYDATYMRYLEESNSERQKRLAWPKSWFKLVNTLFKTVLSENGKGVFYLYLKLNELFDLPNVRKLSLGKLDAKLKDTWFVIGTTGI